MVAFLDYLPRGNTLSDDSWHRRHRFLQALLLAHLPALALFGLARGQTLGVALDSLAIPAGCLLVGRLLRTRRASSLAVTAGLVACSAALVLLSDGSIEAHFHFFVMIGFIALYQDWVPFLVNVVFTILSHGVGSWVLPGRIFNHASGQAHPWTWSLIHGVAVLAACVGVIVFWRSTESEQERSDALRGELAESNRRRFTADLLVSLARRNQNLIYRQLDLLNRLEEHERDAGQLSHLFQLDHLATRIRRNAESLLVLSGEEPARKWGRAVLLVDVVRAAIAEIEELDRVDFAVDESLAVSGRAVADCTHLLAELVENAVQFSPPGMSVMIRTRAYLPQPGAQVLTVEDWGVGMSRTDLDEANDVLRRPRQFDLAVSQRLGLHVVARLAQRYKITVSLEATPGGGVTAVMILPVHLFLSTSDEGGTPPRRDPGRRPFATTPLPPGTLPTTPAGPGSNGHGPNGHAANGRSRASVLDLPPPLTPDPAPAPEPLDEPTAGAAGVGWLGVGGPDVLPERLPAPRADAAASATTAPTELPPSAPSAPSAPAAPAVDGTTVVNGAAADWRSWWTMPLQPEADQRTTRPDPLLDPLDELGDLGALGDLTGDELTGPAALGGLARRTPQASLADELRRTGDRDLPAPQAPSRDAVRANSALSRFQANQRAAREADGGEDRR